MHPVYIKNLSSLYFNFLSNNNKLSSQNSSAHREFKPQAKLAQYTILKYVKSRLVFMLTGSW